MARASDLSPAQVGWTSEWYLRHDTLEHATGQIVDQVNDRACPADGQR